MNLNLTDVIEALVEEEGLNRDKVVSIVCEGMLAAYKKKYPDLPLIVEFNKKIGQAEIFLAKEVVDVVLDENTQLTARKARSFKENAVLGDIIHVPFEEKIGRIEVLTVAKQFIAGKIKELKHAAIVEEFKDKVLTIINGIVHKKEHNGTAIKIGEIMAFLPNSLSVPGETLRSGVPIRALLKEVLMVPRGDYQLILDRSSADFVKKLLELEVPEVFEGIVEIKKIVRIAGYKTKVVVSSNNKEIDPVGTCVGVGGVRIKPILKELNGEKIDLIEWKDSLEKMVKSALKPAEIDKVEIFETDSEKKAIVWLSEDQRSLAIGKMGKNIALASRLTGVEISLQEIAKKAENVQDASMFDDDDDNG